MRAPSVVQPPALLLEKHDVVQSQDDVVFHLIGVEGTR